MKCQQTKKHISCNLSPKKHTSNNFNILIDTTINVVSLLDL